MVWKNWGFYVKAISPSSSIMNCQLLCAGGSRFSSFPCWLVVLSESKNTQDLLLFTFTAAAVLFPLVSVLGEKFVASSGALDSAPSSRLILQACFDVVTWLLSTGAASCCHYVFLLAVTQGRWQLLWLCLRWQTTGLAVTVPQPLLLFQPTDGRLFT